MKIHRITSQHRNDFSAVLECEHCGDHQYLRSGYNDDNYHLNVLPRIKCDNCGKDREGRESTA